MRELSRAEWQEEYRQLNELVQRYDEGVQLFKKDVDQIIDRKRKDEQERIQETYDGRYLKLVGELRVRREQAIAAFERFIQKYPDSEHTPLAMFRLAELYYDEASYAYMAAQDAYSELLKTLKADVEPPPEPKYDFAKSLALYDRIIREFQNFRHIDGVYYMRGYILGSEGAIQFDAEQSKLAWEELITRRPDSVYASQAYLRIGEYHFERSNDGDLQKAIEYYLKVMSYQDKWKDRALYKIAWTYYRLSDYRRGIGYFIELLDFSQAQVEETGQESDLRSEALEYLAISFADSGTVDNALKYFDELGDRSYKKEVLKRLAEIYVAQAKFEEGIATYTKLQELFPYNEENPFFQGEIIKIHERAGDRSAANASAEGLIGRYNPDSDWADKLGGDKAALGKAQELVQAQLKKLAYYYNEQAELATKDDVKLQYFGMAAEKYSEFLRRFPYAKEAYEMQYFYGDCLFYSGQFEAAAAQYDKAMTYTEAKYHADAARGVVEAYENLIRVKEGQEGVEKPFAVAAEEQAAPAELTPEQKAEFEVCPEVAKNPSCVAAGATSIPLSSLKKKYIDGIDVLAKVAPKLDVTPSYRFKASMIYFYHGQYDVAEKRFRELIDQYPTTDVAVKSSQFIVDGLVNQKKWGDVIAAVDGFKTVLGPDARAWNQVLSTLLDIQTKARPIEAACDCNIEAKIQKFLALNTDFGYINAARLQEKLGRVDDALKSYQTLIQSFPKTEFLEEALFRMASNYEKFLDLPKAIENYERIVTLFPRSEKAPICAYNVAFLYQGLKEPRKSARAYEAYATNYSNQDDAESAYFTAGETYVRMEDWNEVIRVSREYIRRYQPPRVNADRMIAAHVRIIDAFDKLGKPKDALEWEKKLPAVVAGLRESPTLTAYGTGLYAKVVFREMPRLLERMNAIKFGTDANKIAAQLDEKVKLLGNQIEGKMQEVVKLGNLDYATAAFYIVGLGYQTFAEDLREAAPEGLDDEGMELFMTMIDEFAIPLEEKALAMYLKNIEVEEKQGVWNEWLEKTYTQLNLLQPADYPARKKERIDVSFGEQPFMAPPFQELPRADGT